MKHYVRIIAITVLSSVIIASAALPAQAQAHSTTTEKAVPFEDICQRIKNRLNVRVGNVTTAKEENITLYEGLNKRFEKVIAAAKEKNYDTTDMEAALETTRAAIAAYDTANKAYTTELTSTASGVCQSETGYKTAITSTRALLKTAREAGLATRKAFQYDVLPELRAYKVWLNTPEPTTDTTTKETE